MKIVVSGPPGCGKSSLISKLIDHYKIKKNFTIFGFLTPDVRVEGKRIGFDIVDIYSGKIVPLARVGNYKTNYRIGKYYIFVEKFENYIKNMLNLDGKLMDLIIIDEIGKMELLSKEFQKFVRRIFNSNNAIIATIGLKLRHPIKDYILKLPNLQFMSLNYENFPLLFQRIISLIS